MKNILMITSGYLPLPPVKGGAVENLTENYLCHNEQEDNLHFVAYSYGEVETEGYEKRNTEYRFIKKNKFLELTFKIVGKISFDYLPSYFLYCIKKDIEKRNEQYDCAIIENRPKFAIYSKRKICKNIILHAHNEWFGKHPEKIYQSCDKIIVVSDYMKKKYKNSYTDGKILSVFNAIDENNFMPKAAFERNEIASIKKRYSIPLNDKVILFTGKIKKEKGALELLKAFQILNNEVNDISLVMAGDIVGDKEFSEKVREITNNSKIIMTGFIDYDKLPELYIASDVQVIPSQVEDMCPLTAFEGICANIPQIVSRSGGIPEIVDGAGAVVLDRGDNFVFKLYKTMRDIITDEEKINNMIKKQKEKSKEYKNSIFCSRMLEEISKSCN